MKQIGYGLGQTSVNVQNGPPPGLLCYPFRATAFQALILHEQLKTLDSRLERYRQGALYLERRLRESTKIRFQPIGRKAEKQGYFGWVMIFDDPEYQDVPLMNIQKAMNAEGLPIYKTWDPVYRFVLFNLKPEAYRINSECSVTESVGGRVLWLLHAYLGLEAGKLEKIADVIEKVASNIESLRVYVAAD
jgi:dTDP-4-amino-4,6-dideoxygalactose transaminase